MAQTTGGSGDDNCVRCGKAIVLQPGTGRWRSTEFDVAVDRMACENASDRHHQPAEQAEMRRILPRVPPAQPQFRTADLP